MKLLVFVTLFLPAFVMAQDLDTTLRLKIDRFNLSPLQKIQDNNPRLTQLGGNLFRDPILSGKQNIACQACHHPRFGTSDALPVSIGAGGRGMGDNRRQFNAKTTPRHANHLFNKGHASIRHMFWDGRVSIDQDGNLQTPEPALNGSNPAAAHIAKLIKTPLEAQALFPIASEAEMFGDNRAGLTNLEKWQQISDQVWSRQDYAQEFKRIFNITQKDFNIAYVAKALGQFQKITFQITDTKWDRYLAGDNNALNIQEKKGAVLFMSKARCIACHNGALLGGRAFQNSAAPQLNKEGAEDDLGLYAITGVEGHKYMFKIPPLRNVAKTAPYFHTGSVQTLEEVVEHYNDPWTTLRQFSAELALAPYTQNYQENFVEMTSDQVEARLDRLPMFYRHHGPLGLSAQEKVQLVEFLRYAL